MEEIYIWKEIFVNFERCWINYNTSNKLDANSIKNDDTINKICNENKENLNIPLKKLETQESAAILNRDKSAQWRHCSTCRSTKKYNLLDIFATKTDLPG